MRNPRKRWLLTVKIAVVGALLLPLIVTALELWSRWHQAKGFVFLPGDHAMVGWITFGGYYLGLMIGLVVNAIAMVLEEPRPHW